MKRCLFHRILTLTLALLMVCSQFCVSNVFAQGIDEEIYRANVGGTAKLNDTTIYISDNPVSSTNFFEHTLDPDTIAANADTVFAIVDCYVGNSGYWYKLSATAGQTLPEELAAKPWVYQNDILSGAYEDALTVTPPLRGAKSAYNHGAFGYLIGREAEMNFEDYAEMLISNDPTTASHDSALEFYATDIPNWPLKLVIEDVHWVEETTELWLKVAMADGSALPEKLQQNPWVFQNETSIYEDEELIQYYPDMLIVTLPESGFVDQTTGVKVTGNLPAGAQMSVTVPELGGDEQIPIFDIKIYGPNGEEWQPIDEGKTVTISLPVPYDEAGLTHVIDYAGAIEGRSDLTFVPVAEIAEASLLSLLGPAMDAFEAVYGNRDYVAVEEMAPVPAVDGMASFEVNSFSIYIPFDGKHQDASTDWEAYQGYETVEVAKAAVQAGTAYVYKIKRGESLIIPYVKSKLQSLDKFYTFATETDTSYSTYLNVTRQGSSGLLNYKELKIEAKSGAPLNEKIYISYIHDPASSRKTIILEIVDEIENIVDPNGIPLYIGIDRNLGSDFHKEPLTVSAMEGNFFWYQNGGGNNTIAPYADSSNALFACTSFENSMLKPNEGAVRAIIDYSGILTQNFINLSDSFVKEIVTRLDKDMNAYTLLVYAVKGIYDGNTPKGYYIMCKLIENSAAVISYYPNTPYGFSESVLIEKMKLPEVEILTKGDPYTIKDIDRTDNAEGVFETSDGSNLYKIKFLGWSSEPNPHYEDFPKDAGASTADDPWYFPGEEITLADNLQLYAVWKPENPYSVADIKFTCEILDEEGRILDNGTAVEFTVDSRFAGYEYVICNAMGAPQGTVETFTGGDTISLQHGYFLMISDVDTLDNAAEPYVITCTSGGYYASEEAAKTEFWITQAENTTGLFVATFTAQVQSYTLTWVVDDGKTEVKTYYYGNAIEAPTLTEKNGYTFGGWSQEVPATMPSYDLTISAIWNIDTYNITYDLNGGTGSAPAATYTIADSVELPSSDLQMPGYAFNGWKPSSDVGNWSSGTIYYGTLSGMYGNVTLTAQWMQKDYTITYDYAGGSLPSGTPYVGGYQTGETIQFYAPERNGYTFGGWKVTSTSGDWLLNTTYEAGDTVSGVHGNVTLTAQWTPTVYTITYHKLNGDEVVIHYTVESEDISIPNLWKQEQEFLGWTKTDSSEPPIKNLVIPTGSTGNRVYTANWGEINQYNITFEFDNGRATQTYTVDYGSTLALPTTPTKNGYTFGGWKVTETDGEWPMGQVYTSELAVLSGNVTLTAVWVSSEHTITFNTDGGTPIDPITLQTGETVPVPANPTKEGYTFAGWDKEIPTTMPAEDITITAKWTIDQYTITFNTDGGTAVTPITQDYGTTVKAPSAPPVKKGYTFAGWDKEIPATMPAENITITAKWTINQYTITFNTDDGSVVAPITQDYGTTVTAPANPTKTGYTFTGWDKEIPDTMPAENITITALWTINQYTITFDTAGGSAVASITQDYDTAVTAPANPTKTGYTFTGWDIAIPATMPAENITITAKWTINQYTITFDTDDGTAVTPITQDYGTAVTAPANPTKTGYTFAGWDKEIPATMPAKDITITAKWTINQYTITFDTAGGSAVASITQDYGSVVTAPANPTKDGCIFNGWDPGIPTTMPAGNITITAQWKTWMEISVEGPIGSTFVFNIKGDGLDMLVVVEGGSSVSIGELRVDTQYTVTVLSGWSWKYNVTGETYTITLPQAGTNNEIEFVVAQSNNKHWLGGEGKGIEAVSK